MKNFTAFILAAALMLSMTACSEEKTTDTESEIPNEETVTIPSEEEVEEETPVEEVEEEEPEEADYSGDQQEWLYQPTSDDETTLSLMEIDACEYGTAGASLKQTSAAVQVLKLSQQEEVTEPLSAYLDGMTATQKDYFSFQWQMAFSGAEELLTAEDAADRLEEAGHGDLDLTQYNADDLNTLHETVMTVLKEQNVTDVWKDHSDLEPFIHWAQEKLAEETTATL